MTAFTAKVFYDTCKQQVGTPSTIYDLGQITCRTIQKFSREENSTADKIQNLILNPARNLLGIYTFQDNLFKFWEAPALSKGLQTIKNTCDVLPIFVAINLIESASLEYVSYIKTPINFIQSSYSLYESVSAASPSVSLSRSNELDRKKAAVKNLLEQLTIVNDTLQARDPSKENCLYKACQKLEVLISATDELVNLEPQKSFGILNRMILNSKEINKNLTAHEILKLKEILNKHIKQGSDSQALQNISEEFKLYLDTVNCISDNKTLLEVLKTAISWILGFSSILSLFFSGFNIPGTTFFCLELCSFIVRLSISTYNSYLNNL